MKKLLLTLLMLSSLIIQPVLAETTNILIVPADLFNVCNNYYCFPEASEIFAEDTIKNINSNGKITAPSLPVIRGKLASEDLKTDTEILLNNYKKNERIDFETLKTISNSFETKSVLLINSQVTTDRSNIKRGIWETLEITSTFNAVYPFKLETTAVLIDTTANIIVWKGTYTKNITNRENMFWARNSSQANAKLENLRAYSADILSREIVQSLTLKFYPKTFEHTQVNPTNKNLDGSFFRLNKTVPIQETAPKENLNDAGEILYGI